MYQSEPPRKNNASPQHVPVQREEAIRSPQTESFSPDKEMFASGTGTAQLMALQKVFGNRGTMQRVRAEQQANALIQCAAEEEAGEMDELKAMMQSQEMEGAAEAPSGAIPVQRMEAEDAPEADELEALLQAQEVEEGTTSDDMPVQRAVEAAPSSAESHGSAAALNQTGMPDALKSGIESMSGMDMSDVRVHYNSREPDKVNAHAYAQGSDIHLAPGQDQHLPHEAWHVVQQRQGRVQPTMQLESGVSINDDAGLEQEATDMGARALSEGVTQRQVDLAASKYKQKGGKIIQAKLNGKTGVIQLNKFLKYVSPFIRSLYTNSFRTYSNSAGAAKDYSKKKHIHLNVNENKAMDYVEKFLGPGEQTSINPFTLKEDHDRIFVRQHDGTVRSWRMGDHETKSPNNQHYHLETWSKDGEFIKPDQSVKINPTKKNKK
ncbi:DUF4157 domain-containing protein [Paenibacillus hunanensis]|uniref:eCIS core domain-containing protein n=1 Tax=Paenibacillus hunanensis TaxID=539262 RepID=UPI002A6A45BC|nr:DUF4157 domain-containing protein [Paenibacillus hunanensis]WPP41926.1 DUF4157 domain-containing protein [Paenibacillus hunanensis]